MLDNSGPPVGFVENSGDPHDLQAWCHTCEELFLEEQQHSPQFLDFNDAKAACVVCYAGYKQRDFIAANQ